MKSGATEAIKYAREGNLDKARQIAENNLSINPNDAELWHLLGVLDNMTDAPSSALTRFLRAIELHPAIAKYHSNLGNTYTKLSRIEEAEKAYRRALELEPNNGSAAYNLAFLLFNQSRFNEALETLKDVDANKDPSGETYHLLGKLYQKFEQDQQALTHYQAAVALNPLNSVAWAQLADLQELMNQLPEARQSMEKGLELTPDSVPLRVVKARLLRREKKFADAIETINSLDLNTLPDSIASNLLNEWGTCLDRLDRPSDAMVKFVAAKRRQYTRLPNMTVESESYLDRIDKTLNLDFSQLAQQEVANHEPEPVFLIGFPRSGTTLLDQILDSHPSIQTLEEKPLITTLVEAHPEYFAGDINKAIPLPTLVRHEIQRVYFDLVSQHLELLPGNVLVDKFPLNITRVHNILQIFPRARFILALRHSCDVVLSCQMHLFNPNAAMAHFQTVEETAKMYAKVMLLWQKFSEELQLSYHIIRYENLVSRFEDEIRGLLEYLKLPWDENLRKHTAHALNRGRINTPSYHQVAEPIYARAAGRWVRYRHELESVLPVMEPAMRYLGYSASTN